MNAHTQESGLLLAVVAVVAALVVGLAFAATGACW